MKTYTLTLGFENLDNFLDTTEQASMEMPIRADNYSHAYLLSQRISKVFEADYFLLDEVGGELK